MAAATAPVRDIQRTVWFQGFLADVATSEPIDAVYDINAALYTQEVGGSPVWGPELHRDVPVVEGWFNIELGAVSPPLPDFAAPNYYLELDVDGETLSPRSKLASIPTAILSSASLDADADWAIDGSDIFRESGRVGIGTTTPGTALDVDGTIRTTDFQLSANPSLGHVLMSDATGVGTWQPLPGGIGGGGTAGYVTRFNTPSTIGNSAVYESEGRIAIGTTTTTGGKLTVENAGLLPTLVLRNTSSRSDVTMLHMEMTEPMYTGDNMIDLWIPDASTGGTFIHCYRETPTGFQTPFWVANDGEIMSTGGAEITEFEDLQALYVRLHRDDDDAKAIEAHYSQVTSPHDGTAVYGESAFADYYGYGGRFEGGYVGALGSVDATGDFSYFGLEGVASGTASGLCIGVSGAATGAGINYGVFGSATGGSENWAGYFFGDVRVTGSFVNAAAALEIDDPSDPANGYLRHPYIVSSEMKTMYDGTVVLDSQGEAWVEMPDWCEALNGDFRYQLTPVGAPAPNLYVADEVSGGRFRIAGGQPGMKVCWMLTGVRRDASAASRASDVRVAKTGDEVGRYLDPAAYGAPESQAIGVIRNEKAQR